MLKFGIVGIGQAGSNIADYAYTKGFTSLVINTAKIDLETLKYIPQEDKIHLEGYSGAGRDMNVGMEAVVENAQQISQKCYEKFENVDTVFVALGGGGGTGAGGAEVLIDILLEMFNIVNVLFILPDDSESYAAKINAYDSFSKISQNPQLGSVFILDNQKAKLQNNRKPKSVVHATVNSQIINLLVEINKLTDIPSYTNNFDDRDYLDILNTRGCSLVAKTILPQESLSNENEMAATIQKSWKSNCITDCDTQDILKAAILASVKCSYSSKFNLDKIFTGNVPFDIKDSLYSNGDNIVYSLFSGLSFPNLRMNEMKSSIEQAQEIIIKRMEKSMNQSMTHSNWNFSTKKNIGKKARQDSEKKESLAERMKKFK